MAAMWFSLIFLIFASLPLNSYQLRCYECTEGDKDLGDNKMLATRDIKTSCGNFSEALLVDCPKLVEVCEKNEGNVGGSIIAIHSCGTTEKLCKSKDGMQQENTTISCYSCEGDGCNSASAIVAATSLLVVSLFAAKFN